MQKLKKELLAEIKRLKTLTFIVPIKQKENQYIIKWLQKEVLNILHTMHWQNILTKIK